MADIKDFKRRNDAPNVNNAEERCEARAPAAEVVDFMSRKAKKDIDIVEIRYDDLVAVYDCDQCDTMIAVNSVDFLEVTCLSCGKPMSFVGLGT